MKLDWKSLSPGPPSQRRLPALTRYVCSVTELKIETTTCGHTFMSCELHRIGENIAVSGQYRLLIANSYELELHTNTTVLEVGFDTQG